MKKIITNFKLLVLVGLLATSVASCSKDDDKKGKDDTPDEPVVENFVGNWDATKLYYVMDGKDTYVDDLIAMFVNPKEGETEEEKASREKTLQSLQNNKAVMEDLWHAEVLADGTGVVTYEGKGDSWNDAVKWTKNEDGTYAFTYGVDEYETPTTLTLESKDAGFFIIKGTSIDFKVIIERVQ